MAKRKSAKRKSRRRSQTPAPLRGGRGQPRAADGIVDIVMPVFGEWHLAEKAVRSIPQGVQDLPSPFRVIVVDNGSPDFEMNDGTIVKPDQQSQGVRDLLRPKDGFYRLEENRGYPGGVNYGVSKGRNPLIIILTADIELRPNAITAMVRELDNPAIGVVGAKLMFSLDSPHGPQQTPGAIQHAGHAFDISGTPFHIFIGWNADHPKVNVRREMMSVTGALFGTRRNLWNAIGGLDEQYGAGTYEDVDYCFAARAHGTKVVYSPAAEGYHYVGGSIATGAQKGGFNLQMNHTIFQGKYAKYLEWDEWRYW